MSNTLEQAVALTTIRNLVEKHFPEATFSHIEYDLKNAIDLMRDEEVMFDDATKRYIVQGRPYCKVCETEIVELVEIPTMNSIFYLCTRCKHDIVSSPTLAEVK